jgi:hypothetical protein
MLKMRENSKYWNLEGCKSTFNECAFVNKIWLRIRPFGRAWRNMKTHILGEITNSSPKQDSSRCHILLVLIVLKEWSTAV